jgi:putative membrane protein
MTMVTAARFKERIAMRPSTPAIGLLVGLGLLICLVLWSGIGQVLTILSTAGVSLLLIVLLAPAEQIAASEAWRQLFPQDRTPTFWKTLRASWMGMAVNALLPVATIGGEVVKARALVISGTPLTDTASATLVDKAVQAVATLVWGIVGLAVLSRLTDDQGILQAGLIGAALLAIGIGGFIALQISGGVSYLARISGGLLKKLDGRIKIDNAKHVDLAVRAIYQRPGALLRSFILRLAGQIWLVSEVLLTAYLLGLAMGFLEALMLRALIGAVRGLSFAVPAGLGLQEGAYIALGALVGMPPDMMLALSLASRLREILPNLPALLLWQQAEGRRFWQTRDPSHLPGHPQAMSSANGS